MAKVFAAPAPGSCTIGIDFGPQSQAPANGTLTVQGGAIPVPLVSTLTGSGGPAPRQSPPASQRGPLVARLAG